MRKTVVFMTLLLVAGILTGCGAENKMNGAKILSCKASSTLEPHRKRYTVDKMFDRNMKTCWAEGVKGAGEGSTITITFDKMVELNKLYIVNGLGNMKYYKKNNRVKNISVNGYHVELDDSGPGKWEAVSLPETLKTRKLEITILSVYETEKWDDTCISELSFKSPEKKE